MITQGAAKPPGVAVPAENQWEVGMAEFEQIALERYAKELEDDMRHLLKKYCRMMGWNVPELDEEKARELILASMQDALSAIKNG